jgi:glycosyltransferase involved in cell wall biosynthesis
VEPLISVIVPTRDRPGLLAEALTSVAIQRDLPGPVEVVVVNDAGCDVAVVVQAACEHGLRARLIDHGVNRGLSAARNTGIEGAHGQYLAFLDDDDVFLPDHLARMMQALGGQGTDAAYGDCLVRTERLGDPATAEVPDPPHRDPFDAGLLAVANTIPVHTAVIRRPPPGVGFDVRLSALEDWDMWQRLVRQERYRFVHVPVHTVVYHRIPAAQSMCGATVGDPSALARFGDLTRGLWRRWPAPSTRAHHFRLYIAVMYWQALTHQNTGGCLPEDYFLTCMTRIAQVWHGHRAEDDLVEQITRAVTGGTVRDAAA